MNKDTRLQLKVVVGVQMAAIAFLTAHLWPEAEAKWDMCGGETIYHMPKQYRLVGFDSIAHYADEMDKISDDPAVIKPVFDEEQQRQTFPSFYEPLWLHQWVIDMHDRVVVTPPSKPGGCANEVSEPGVLWLAIIGITAMIITRRWA